MKILKAKNKPKDIKISITLFNVNELKIIPSDHWLTKRSNKFEYPKSFENHGMLYPIVVSDEKPEWVQRRIVKKNPQHTDSQGNLKKGYYVHLGNKRVKWAKENNFDKIEGYFIIEKSEKDHISNLTHIQHTEIPK